MSTVEVQRDRDTSAARDATIVIKWATSPSTVLTRSRLPHVTCAEVGDTWSRDVLTSAVSWLQEATLAREPTSFPQTAGRQLSSSRRDPEERQLVFLQPETCQRHPTGSVWFEESPHSRVVEEGGKEETC